jgi:sugar transferase EpsL
VVKRTIDVVGSTLGLLLLSPLMAVVATLVAVRLGRPVLFHQRRPGRHGHLFTLIKFRTMTGEQSPEGHLLPDADRLTTLGKFLRSTSLDELPELWNVLRGDMSLVGPRPLMESYLDRYSAHQARRHEVRPGITGWAQVNGRNATTWTERLEMDVWYVDHRSLRLDGIILWRTLRTVFSRQGITADGHATMPEFKG